MRPRTALYELWRRSIFYAAPEIVPRFHRRGLCITLWPPSKVEAKRKGNAGVTGSTLRVAVVGCGNIAGQRPQRPTGAQAAHVVEILNAIDNSLRRGGPVDITSSFTPPQPMEWAQ